MRFLSVFKVLFVITFLMATLVAVISAVGYFYLNPKLPSIEGLSDVQLQVPLRIYSSDGSLMGVFGEKRRTPKKLEEIPGQMRNAFLSAEDDRFYSHPGVDYQGILRAVMQLVLTGKRGQGGSTITMQLARNFYLSSEKTYLRKMNEILLALKIERELDKNKILELYLNKIYLGNRSYGVAAAAQVYYGLGLDELSLAQIAMIAGLPKAPSTFNPIINPDRAVIRRNYVLSRMHQLKYISSEEYDESIEAPVTAVRHRRSLGVYAPYVNEMVRAEIVKQFGGEAYARGLSVYTTIDKRLQQAGNDSIWNGLTAYDRRHGYRGVIRHVDLNEEDIVAVIDKGFEEISEAGAGGDDLDDQFNNDTLSVLLEILKDDKNYGRFVPALILSIVDDDLVDVNAKGKATNKPVTEEGSAEEKRSAIALLKDGSQVMIPWNGIEWARKYISVNRIAAELKKVSDVINPGDVVWLAHDQLAGWSLAQAPTVQGALVSVNPNTGAIQALNGGFDFSHSKFNRVVQSKRQAGSGFKPIVYAAALDKKYTPASLINDAPVVFQDAALEGAWRPENYSGRTFGPTRLRMALYKSRNLVSIRILRSIGIKPVLRYAENFGLKGNELPHDLSLSLGSAELSPLQLSRIYSVFANGGYLIKPYLIQRIEDADGSVLFEADPAVACTTCLIAEHNGMAEGDEEELLEKLPKQAEQTLEPRLAYQMNSILQDVVLRGTGRRALALGRKDLAGKTGTTNDQRDAWFNGYSPDLVTITWVGFDQLKPLGNRETAARAALPIWIDYMKIALADKPERQLIRPDGLVTMKINAETGEAANDDDSNTVFEIFRKERVPVAGISSPLETPENGGDAATIPEQLF